MKKRSHLLIILLGACLLTCAQQVADNMGNTTSMLSIYLDCDFCDLDYIKSNYKLVNYVVERKSADVHVMILSIASGSGGKEYSMRLLGQGRYKAWADTVVFSIPADVSNDNTRSEILANLKLGLVPFIMKTPQRDKLSLYIDDWDGEENEGTREKDPWRDWMFRMSGTGSIFNQKSDRSVNLVAQLYISKVTPQIKLESQNNFGYNEMDIRLFVEDTVVYRYFSAESYYSSNNLFVKSVGDHFGIGGVTNFCKSHYSNLSFQATAGPAIEYNIFSYDDATQRQLRFIYAIMFEHTQYIDSTVYGMLSSDLFSQELHIKFMHIAPWGSINVSAFGSGYLYEYPSYTVGATASADIYLFKGLSFNISGGYTYLSDQFSLRKDLPGVDDMIIKQKEMETDYSYNLTIGLSYRFGSIYNNTVNPRFGD